jgi:hypothetical protein
MKFFLGSHMPHWLRTSTVPLFVSHRRLAKYKKLPRALTSWSLDSGGFSELSMFGGWVTTPRAYVAATRRYQSEIGLLDWAAPQDWMCEPFMLNVTGRTVQAHQLLTIRSLQILRDLWPDGPFVPVLQGWTRADYLRHVEMYESNGIDLTKERVVGLGSVCRRQAMGEAFEIVTALQPLNLHGFGMKTEGLAMYGDMLASADSMAWSFAGRKRGTCTHKKSKCANCHHWALEWRENALNPRTPSLFGAG